jgi:hypothetical protein
MRRNALRRPLFRRGKPGGALWARVNATSGENPGFLPR